MSVMTEKSARADALEAARAEIVRLGGCIRDNCQHINSLLVQIDAERALNAELTERYNELVKLTVPSDSDAEEKANLRALNAEMLAVLQGVAKWCHQGHGFFPAKQCGACKPILEMVAKAEGRAR